MNYLFAVGLCLYSLGSAPAQSISFPTTQLEHYFKINSQQTIYEGKTYTQVYPALTTKTDNSLAAFMHQHPRRFEYILQNKTQFADYSDLYPDTVRMTKSYVQRLSVNKPFLSYFSQLSSPIVTPQKTKKELFKKDEMMLVASRFFLCDQVRPDTTISWHVCIGLNGMKEANWKKDYTLLEAFCFEAIFDKMFSKNEDETKYMEQFLKYVDQDTKKHRTTFKTKEQLLEAVKTDVFSHMQSDQELQRVLTIYYRQNEKSLPFRIN